MSAAMMDFEKNGNTINMRLQFLAEEEPDKPAFIFWDKNRQRNVLTRQDVWDKSTKCAAFFRRHGIVKGDVVCNTLVNSPERLITAYGTILAGGVYMHGQKFLADGEDLIKNLGDAECKSIIINPDEEKGVCAILEKMKYTDDKTGAVKYQGLPHLSQVIPVALGDNKTRKDWLQFLDQEFESYVDETVTEDDNAVILCTSGSTGFAKLIPHTHKRLAIVGNYIKTFLELNKDSKHFNDRSLGWMGGIPLAYPITGLTRILVDLVPGKTEDAGALMLHILEQEMCDTGMSVPNSIQEMLDHLDSTKRHKLPKLLRVIGTGGGPVSKATMKGIGRISESISILYGATEFGITLGINVTDDSTFENACCGYPAKETEIKIVDRNLLEVATGESGEVLFRGPSLFPGYLNNPKVNKETFLEDGWWRTSDIGFKDEKGQTFVFCRKSNAINHKGFFHYPGTLEVRLDKHPDIVKSMAVGVPDPIDYEHICICIVKTPESTMTATEANEYFKTLFLTSDANDITPIPKYYLFFDAFPLNANGKIDRKAVKKLALDRIHVEYKN